MGSRMAEFRAHQKCKRCRKTRAELSNGWWEKLGVTGVSFNYGYCLKCYYLKRAYQDDENLMTNHELTQQLKGELRNVKRKKHSRPSQSAAGGNRGSAEGESRPSSSAGDFGSFFSYLTVSPTGF